MFRDLSKLLTPIGPKLSLDAMVRCARRITWVSSPPDTDNIPVLDPSIHDGMIRGRQDVRQV